MSKWTHAFKDYTGSYSIEILNSFNPELQLKDTKSAIKNKQKKLLTELRIQWKLIFTNHYYYF